MVEGTEIVTRSISGGRRAGSLDGVALRRVGVTAHEVGCGELRFDVPAGGTQCEHARGAAFSCELSIGRAVRIETAQRLVAIAATEAGVHFGEKS